MDLIPSLLPLYLTAATGLSLGGLAFLSLLRRGFRRLRGRAQPGSAAGAVFVLCVAVLLGGVGLAAGGLALALDGYRAFTRRTHAAEVQCIELQPGKLRLYLVEFDSSGARGPTQTFDLDGDEWTVGGDVLRFRPLLTRLGVDTVYRLTRVEGRWKSAADANAHKATAFDLAASSRAWLALYDGATRGPLGMLVAGAHGQAVSQLPDRRALYDLFVSADGLTLEKHAM